MDARHNTTIQPRSVKPTRQQLEKAAVLYYLIHDCLAVTTDLVRDLERHQKLTLRDIEDQEIRSIPSEFQNFFISTTCLEKFGPSVMRSCGLFYSFTRAGCVCSCFDYTDKCECHLETWRLDVDPRHARGLLLPISDRRYGFYVDLMVFRHCRDEDPFILKLGADQELAA